MVEGYNMNMSEIPGYNIGELVEEGQYGRTYKVLKQLTQVTFYIYSIFIIRDLYIYMII